MAVLVSAWGSKHGPTPSSDLVFVLTGLHNPYRIKGLRYLTGHDPEVRANVWESEHAEERYARILVKVSERIRGGADTTVIFVCHAGRHRSVTFARRLVEDVRAMGVEAELDTPFAEGALP